jgi:hypothetical protein
VLLDPVAAVRRSSNPTLLWLKHRVLFLALIAFFLSLFVEDRAQQLLALAVVVAAAVWTVQNHRRTGAWFS